MREKKILVRRIREKKYRKEKEKKVRHGKEKDKNLFLKKLFFF